MKLLITGASGQLGGELRRCLENGRSELGPVPDEYRNAVVDCVDHAALDVADAEGVRRWFAEHGPYDLVINCAAFTKVDECETLEAEAFHVNAIGAENLARAAAACSGKLVQVSTDYVFSGTERTPRIETDPVRPVSAYGRTKWAGEVLARAACPRCFIVRTAWLYGLSGRNFVKTILRLAEQQGGFSVVSDQFGNPTNAEDVAHEILRLGVTQEYGVYHCTNEGVCSWFELASAAADLANLVCDKRALTSSEYKRRFPHSADRPRFSGLENRHLAETVGNDMRPWRTALESFMQKLRGKGDAVRI